jgi:hypothetical protein
MRLWWPLAWCANLQLSANPQYVTRTTQHATQDLLVRMPLGLNVEKKKDQMHMVYEVVSDKSRRLIITAGLGSRV